MKSPFELALSQTLGFEGGEANLPGDRGGHTYRGITQRLYDACRRKWGLYPRSVVEIEDGEIVRIAREEFWLPCRCGDLPQELALAVFDMAFHSSPRDAIRSLQKAVGAAVDGAIGQETLAAVERAPADTVLRDFLKARGAEMQEIIIHDYSQVQFLEGWINRLLDSMHNAYRRAP